MAIFFRAQLADRNVAAVPWSAAAGVSAIGLLPGRDADTTGLAVAYNGFTNAADADFHGDEVILEAFYRIQVCENFFIKPDVQYIASPGGANDDALLVAIRAGIEF